MSSRNRVWIVGVSGVALGFVSGVVVTLAVQGGTPTPSEAPARAPLAEVSPPRGGPVPVPPSAPIHDPAPDLAQVVAALEAASDPLAGPAPDWSPGVGYQAPAVRSSLEAAFPGTEIHLDCREFPCVGVIETGPEVPAPLARDIEEHGIPRDAYAEVGDQLSSLGLDEQSLAVHQTALDGGGYRILVAWLSEERDAELSTRLQARIAWLAEHGGSVAREDGSR
jgi:hypothetical protein